MLFLAFSAAYIYTRVESNGLPPVKLPSLFIFNTLLLIASSLCIRWANQCYLKDKTGRYQWALLITIILTVLFLVFQIVGWRQLFNQDLFLTSTTSGLLPLFDFCSAFYARYCGTSIFSSIFYCST